MEQIPGLLYSTRGDDVSVNLYAGNRAAIHTAAGVVRIDETTEYPWQGAVRFTIDVEAPRAFALRLRVPWWQSGSGLPGGLYEFTGQIAPLLPRLTVNGRPVEPRTDAHRFIEVRRTWKKGDSVSVTFDMAPRTVFSDKAIADNVGKVAVLRGPIVYALEAIDNGGAALGKPLDAESLTAEFRGDLLGGVEIVKAGTLTFVPYYAWANRGAGEMAVWIPAAARPR
jgi:DUF1680 family protein